MSTAFQNTIQTLCQMHESDQAKIERLEQEKAELASQLETASALLSVSELKAVQDRAAAEDVSVRVWLRDMLLIMLSYDVDAVFLEKRAYTALCNLAQRRGIDIGTLMTRSSVTEFILRAVQQGAF